MEMTIRIALHHPIAIAPRDLHAREQFARTFQDAAQRQLKRHHRAPHAPSSAFAPSANPHATTALRESPCRFRVSGSLLPCIFHFTGSQAHRLTTFSCD